MVVPMDVFSTLCTALMRQSDAFLLLTQRVCKAVEQHGDDKLLDDMTVLIQAINARTQDMQEILRAVLHEQDAPPGGSNGRA